MSITFVNSAGTANTVGTADVNLRIAIPTGVQVGHTLFAAYTNVGNYRSINNVSPSLNSGWAIVKEVTDTTNAYFIVVGKVLDATDVANAGTTQIVGTFPNTSGNTVYASRSVVYSGVDNSSLTPPSGNAVLLHDPSPTGSLVTVGAVGSSTTGRWELAFYGSAKNSGTNGPGTWTMTSQASRGSTGSGATLTATVGAVDSNGVSSNLNQPSTGSISYTPSRTNAVHLVLEPALVPALGAYSREYDFSVTLVNQSHVVGPVFQGDDPTDLPVYVGEPVRQTDSTTSNVSSHHTSSHAGAALVNGSLYANAVGTTVDGEDGNSDSGTYHGKFTVVWLPVNN